MSKKHKFTGIMYSTNPDYVYKSDKVEITKTLEAKQQNLKIHLDKKQRRGKKVTLITGFVGTNDDLVDLSKILKSKCGVGGSAKDGEIIIQGELREKVKGILEGMGYKCKLAGG